MLSKAPNRGGYSWKDKSLRSSVLGTRIEEIDVINLYEDVKLKTSNG